MSVQVKAATCELCHTEAASFYCDSDAAFLCSSCDHSVHSANFLFARHLRRPIHGGSPFSGPSPPLSSSSCTSTSESRRLPARSCKAIFVKWCRRLGVGGERSSWVVRRASRVVRAVWSTVVGCSHPRFRVWLAASFWFGMRMSAPAIATWRNLKALEDVSSVPAKLIASVEAKIEFALVARRTATRNNNNNQKEGLDLEEGWAESSI